MLFSTIYSDCESSGLYTESEQKAISRCTLIKTGENWKVAYLEIDLFCLLLGFQVWQEDSAVYYHGDSDSIHLHSSLLPILADFLHLVFHCWNGPDFKLFDSICFR